MLALLTKFSSLAAPAAAFFFLLLRDRRQCLCLVLACTVLGLSALALVDGLSQGRFLMNLRALADGGSGWSSVLQAPFQMRAALGLSVGFAVVLPLLAVGLLVRAGRFHWCRWDWYFLTALFFTLVVFTSRGTADNHLVELETAGVLLLARIVTAPARTPACAPTQVTPARPASAWAGLERLLQPLASAAALLVLLLGVGPHIAFWQAKEGDGLITKRQVEEAIPANARLLAEAPTIPVLRDQRPVVLDAFNFEILARTGKIDDAALAERIRQQDFDVLVLLGRIDRPGESLCPDYSFGPRVTQAMLDHYRFDRRLGAYVLFVRR